MPTPEGKDAVSVTANAHMVGVEIDITELKERMETEAIRLTEQFSRQGLEGEELAAAVQGGLRQLSDAPVNRASRAAISSGFNLGRNLEAQRRAEDIEQVVRSEILDTETCAPCQALDGQIFVFNSPEYFEFMPPTKCNGRDFCRGFYIYDLKDEAA